MKKCHDMVSFWENNKRKKKHTELHSIEVSDQKMREKFSEARPFLVDGAICLVNSDNILTLG